MFELLTEKLSKVFNNLRSRGRLSERDIQDALKTDTIGPFRSGC